MQREAILIRAPRSLHKQLRPHPSIDLAEVLAMTVPSIVAHDSAQRDGESLAIPSYL